MDQDPSTSHLAVFVGGEDGFPVYRIPSVIVTASGKVLAFAEGRKSISDHSGNRIVCKTSDDDGATWSRLNILASMGRDSLNNPQVVQDQETGRIILFFQRHP